MSRSFPRNLFEFERRFRTEEDCVRYLVQVRWPDGFRCRRCGSGRSWTLSSGLRQCAECKKMTSVTAGTIFHRSHLPLRVWFRAIWSFTNQKNGMSALGLQRTLGLGSYRTAWLCLHKLRKAMIRPERERLNGKVEVDESWIGGKRPGRSRGKAHGLHPIIAIAAEIREKGIGRIRLKRIRTNDSNCLRRFIEDAIEPGSTLVTDGWPAYKSASSKYEHEEHPLKGTGHSGSAVLPRVHRVAALFKRWVLGTHQGRLSTEHLDAYLEEFSFRFNRRNSVHRGQLFYRLIQHACRIEPTSYSQFVHLRLAGT